MIKIEIESENNLAVKPITYSFHNLISKKKNV